MITPQLQPSVDNLVTMISQFCSVPSNKANVDDKSKIINDFSNLVLLGVELKDITLPEPNTAEKIALLSELATIQQLAQNLIQHYSSRLASLESHLRTRYTFSKNPTEEKQQRAKEQEESRKNIYSALDALINAGIERTNVKFPALTTVRMTSSPYPGLSQNSTLPIDHALNSLDLGVPSQTRTQHANGT